MSDVDSPVRAPDRPADQVGGGRAERVGSRPTTATGPTVRSVVRTARWPVLAVLALVLVAGLVALFAGAGAGGALDPRSYSPTGTHALAALLGRQGVPVELVTSTDRALVGATPLSTTVLTHPELLSAADLGRLGRTPGGLLVLGADQAAVDALRLPVDVLGTSRSTVRRPACTLPAAVRAGAVRLGGALYAVHAGPPPAAAPTAGTPATGTGCYASGGAAGLLALPGGRVLLGSAAPLTNERLAEQGDAALALGLLGPAHRVVWLLPADTGQTPGGRASLSDLLPTSVVAAAVQLALGIVVLALWRARRLGRVVTEPLPVVVRAAETVEGRGRLYHATHAHEAAAEALRNASRHAATRWLGVSADGAGLVDAAAARTGRPAAAVASLLYGPVPDDDAALVRLAADLARFDTEVAGS